MQFQLKQAVHLKGRDYARGVYEFSEEVQHDPYFLMLVNAGLIVSADNKFISTETLQERQAKIVNKIVDEKNAKAAKFAPPEESLEGVLADEEDHADTHVEEEHAEKSGKKPKKKKSG